MHTSVELRSESFTITCDDEPVRIEDLLVGFGPQGRLGIIVRSPCGAIGASGLLLAAVTAFYDAQRALSDDFVIYPDYFTFQVGGPLGDHSMLDVWPSHKEVVVPDDPDAILQAVNDRAITWLVVPEGEPGRPPTRRESLASADSRIVAAFAYSPTGRVRRPDVRIAGNEVTEGYVRAVLDPERLLATLGDAADPYAASVSRRAAEAPPQARAQLRAARARLSRGGRPVESYRRLSLARALELLTPGVGVRSKSP